MPIELRHYQTTAVAALFDYFGRAKGNPLLVPDAKRVSFVCYLKHALATAVNA